MTSALLQLRRSRWAWLGVVALVGVCGIAAAQSAPPNTAGNTGNAKATDPLGPVQCYAATVDQSIDQLDALQLCTGAVSGAPAQCYSQAYGDLSFSNRDLVRLCAMATSNTPAICAARLHAATDLASPAIARYCGAQQWTTVASPTPGVPECVQSAVDGTMLSDRQAVDLCRGSSSTAPVACYRWGHDHLSLTDADLVKLCTGVVAYP